MKAKKFDSVKIMREIRKKHYEEYSKNPELREQRLREIRKKYGFKKKKEMNGPRCASTFYGELVV